MQNQNTNRKNNEVANFAEQSEGQAYPSGTDWNSVSNNGKYFRAVISQKEIWLYNKVNHQKVEIRISRAPFKHLDPKKK